MRNSATAQVLRFPGRQPIKIDDGPKTVALVQSEILRSHWTYTRIALAADISSNTVHNIACGNTTRPALRTIVRILMALGWDLWAHPSK